MFQIDDLTPERIARIQASKANPDRLRVYHADGVTPLHGIYEDNELSIRQLFYEGVCLLVVSKMWVDDNTAHKPDIAEAPWGSYPPTPARARKKTS